MPVPRVIKHITDTDTVVITPDEHQVPKGSWTRLVDARIVFYTLQLDGTLVPLAVDTRGRIDTGTCTIQLPRRYSGVLEWWLPAPQAPLWR
jgi:hypothetical protein